MTRLLLAGAHIWSGLPGTGFVRGEVEIDGTRIARVAIGETDDRGAAAGDGSVDRRAGCHEIVDCCGLYLMPGLVNAHVHLLLDGSADPATALIRDGTVLSALKAARAAADTLRAGITTVRDMGAPDGADLALKRAIERGVLPGPRMLVAGRCICMTGGHGYFFGCEADGVDEARKAARLQLKVGADLIKFMATGGVMTPGVEPGSAQLTYDEMAAIVEEAKKAGRLTATHAQGTVGIRNALRAGVDSVEHGMFLDDECIQMMLDRGVFYVPTLAAPYHINKGGVAAGIPEFAVRKSMAVTEEHWKSVRRAAAAGVKIAAGTDSGTPLNYHGGLLVELQLLVEAGLSPRRALVAATSVAADCLGMRDRIGVLEAGKLADILALRANPETDLDALRAPAFVIKDGRMIPDGLTGCRGSLSHFGG